MAITLLQLLGLAYAAGAAFQVERAGGGHRSVFRPRLNDAR